MYKEKPSTMDYEQIGDMWEITSIKQRINKKNPIALGIAVYQNSKLYMLKFIKFLWKHCGRNICFTSGDTDSIYFGMAFKTLQECVKPEKLESWNKRYFKWFPRTDEEFHSIVTYNKKPYTLTQKQYWKREPGLFKEEFYGDWIGLSICSKTNKYASHDGTGKSSRKGVQTKAMERMLNLPKKTDEHRQEQELIKKKKLKYKNASKKYREYCIIQTKKEVEMYNNCLEGGNMVAENRSLRTDPKTKRIVTHSCTKQVASYYYDKHIVSSDGVTCGFGSLHLLHKKT